MKNEVAFDVRGPLETAIVHWQYNRAEANEGLSSAYDSFALRARPPNADTGNTHADSTHSFVFLTISWTIRPSPSGA
jgi:hypothetical protein